MGESLMSVFCLIAHFSSILSLRLGGGTCCIKICVVGDLALVGMCLSTWHM
jgi:hypothetical protein